MSINVQAKSVGGGVESKNQSCSKLSETHYGLGIFEIQ